MPFAPIVPYLQPKAAPSAEPVDMSKITDEDVAAGKLGIKKEQLGDFYKFVTQNPWTAGNLKSAARAYNSAGITETHAAPNYTSPTPPDPNKVTDAPGAAAVPGDQQANQVQNEQEIEAQKVIDQYRRAAIGYGAVKQSPQTLYGPPWLQLSKERQGIYGNMAQADQKLADIDKAQAEDYYKQQVQNRQELETKVAQHQQERQADLEQSKARIDTLSQQADQIANAKLDSGRMFRSPAGIIGAIAAMFIGGTMSAPGAGLRIIDGAIQRDLEAQKVEMSNMQAGFTAKRGLLQDYMRLTGDEEQARLLAESKMKEIAALKMGELAAKYKSDQITQQAELGQNMLRMEALKDRSQAFLLMHQTWHPMPLPLADMWKKAYGGGSPPVAVQPDQSLPVRENPYQPEAPVGEVGKGGIIRKNPYGEPPVPAASGQQPKVQASPEAQKDAVTVLAAAKTSPKYKINGLEHLIEGDVASRLTAETAANGGDRQKAMKAVLKEVESATNGGEASYQKIAGAAAPHISALNRVASLQQKMAYVRAKLGSNADKFFTHPGLWIGGVNAAKWADVKNDIGFTSDAEEQAAKDLHRELMELKIVYGHKRFGSAVSQKGEQSEGANLVQVATPTQSYKDWESFLGMVSTDAQAEIENAQKHGNSIARNIWRSQVTGASRAVPRGATRAYGE